MLCFSSIIFALLIYETTEKFLTNQIVIKPSKKLHSVGEIPFPAVTVCPEPLILGNFSDFYETLSHSSDEFE
jgi:hypothetical protein